MGFGVGAGREERWASAVGGAALVIWGVKKMTADRSPAAALLTTAGAGLICRAAWQRSNRRRARPRGAVGTIVEAIAAINRSPEELYGFWRSLGNLPQIMPELAAVEVIDARRSHWVAQGPGRSRPHWDADIINDVPNELIAWRTTPSSDLVSAGSVRFEPAPMGRGTLVRVKLQYNPPGGRLGRAAAWAMGESPGQVIREGLRRFKQLMESGEIATTEGQPPGGAVKAVVWHGTNDVRVEQVPDPGLLNPRDAIVKVTTTAICGSDLHLFDGFIPTMRPGDILGHEFMGEVVEVGRGNKALAVGDRVVVPFTIACGNCFFCERQLWSACDNSNPNARLVEELYGFAGSGLFGYSHMMGGYAGGQAQYVRVPFADVGPLKVPDTLTDEQVLFLSDIFPTGYMAAENCDIQPGDIVAVWGCGPVGQMAIASALLLGADQVIAIDSVPKRLQLAARRPGVVTINFEKEDVFDRLKQLTAGRGPDACIEAVGLEAHGATLDAYYDRAKTAVFLATDRATALRQAIHACRKAGIVSIPGVYGGFLDKVPFGAAFGKGLTLKMGQTHVMKYLRPLLDRIELGELDPSFVITHRLPIDEAPAAYRLFRDHKDECIKVVLKPH